MERGKEVGGRVGDCALCGMLYENWGHNPQPVLADANYRVCEECNATVVIPVRLGMIKLPWLEERK